MSRQLLALEDELSVKLFVRTPRGMSLSASGQRLLEQARRILGLVDELPTVVTR
jgi:DNA-binding transcriptional LysR family regulator